jgi:hypothetical protein
MNAAQARRRVAVPSNRVSQFVLDRCQFSSYFGEQHKRLRSAYLLWCRDHDYAPMSDHAFCEALITLGYIERGSALMRGWTGLRLI